MNDTDPNPPPLFKDRKVGLTIFGILEILMGALCALALPLMVFSMLMLSHLPEEAKQGTNAAMMIPSLLVYGLGAVFFIWMGIGSITARRWARDLWLVCSWIMLISGTFGMLFFFVFMPDLYQGMVDSGQLPAGMVHMIKIITAGIMLVFYVVIPGALILFYGSKNTRATCRARDPVERWTERCPLPVLAVSLMLGVGGLGMLSMGAYNFAMPFFGVILSGGAGAGVVAVLCVLFLVLARGTYRLAPWAWWGTVAVMGIGMLSWIVTFRRTGLMEYYQRMNLPEASLAMIQSSGMTEGVNMVGYSAACLVLMVGYLVFVRKYFFRPEAPPGF